MDRLATFALARLRPAEGWIPFGLILTTTLCFVGATLSAGWVADDERLVPPVLLAMLVGRWLAWAPWPDWLSWGLASAVGVGLALDAGGRVLPSLSVLGRAIDGELPWPDVIRASTARLEIFIQRLGDWVSLSLQGQTQQDAGIFLFVAGLLAWLNVYYAAQKTCQGHYPLRAWLPAGLLIGLSSYYAADEGLLYFILFLICVLVQLAWAEGVKRRANWERANVDYSDELLVDVGVSAGGVALILIMASIMFVSVYSPDMSQFVWQLVRKPAQVVNTVLERVFAGATTERDVGLTGQTGTEAARISGLPRALLLGGPAELDEQVVMWVQTDDPRPAGGENAPAVKRYWRVTTFDAYSGAGWDHTTPNGVGKRVWPVDEADLKRISPPTAYQIVAQRYELLLPQEDRLFAVNSPVEIETPEGTVIAQWRTPDKHNLVELVVQADRYQVESWAPSPGADVLRGAGTLYPDWVSETYLQLPESVTDRTWALARRVAAGADNPYDVVDRLTRYLRTYAYSLRPPVPPPGRDVVDFFLFEAGQGYCDYYASSLAVMARSLGVPARLAIGYTTGSYHPKREAFLVTQANAHSWVEVYFPGYGWIEFEPTAGQAPFVRSGTTPDPAGEPALPPPAKRPPGRRLVWERLLLAVALGLAGVAGVWGYRRYRQQTFLAGLSRPALAAWLYQGLQKEGDGLGLPSQAGQTPHEYQARLTAHLSRRALESEGWQSRARAAGTAVGRLTEAYIRASYAPPQTQVMTTSERLELVQAWQRLTRICRLFRLRQWLLSLLGVTSRPASG